MPIADDPTNAALALVRSRLDTKSAMYRRLTARAAPDGTQEVQISTRAIIATKSQPVGLPSDLGSDTSRESR